MVMKWLIYGRDRIALKGQSLVVGRDDKCEVKLDEEVTSRRHASLVFQDGEYVLVDHTSRNGTFVNGGRVQGSVPLTHKDRIRIGKTEFVFAEWTPTPGSVTETSRVHDFSFSESTVGSTSGDATQTGTNLICAVLYRNLQAKDFDTARRIVDALSERIAKSAKAGTLEAPELNAVAPAILDYCGSVRDERWITWLMRIYAKRRLFPRPVIARTIRALAVELGLRELEPVDEWLQRTASLVRSADEKDASRELRELLKHVAP